MSYSDRYNELDALRGIAVLSMIAFHLVFDLTYFYSWNIPIHTNLLMWWARGTAALFLLIVGVCFVISWERTKVGSDKRLSVSKYEKYLRRGIIIFLGGMIISLVTWLITPNAYVKFGILHFIGIAALLQPFFVQFRKWNMLIGICMMLLSLQNLPTLNQTLILSFSHPLILSLAIPLGFPPPDFSSLDYYPLIPWFGVILIGMSLGQTLYVPERQFRLFSPPLAPLGITRIVVWSGRQALPLYFFHQPLLWLLLTITLGPPHF